MQRVSEETEELARQLIFGIVLNLYGLAWDCLQVLEDPFADEEFDHDSHTKDEIERYFMVMGSFGGYLHAIQTLSNITVEGQLTLVASCPYKDDRSTFAMSMAQMVKHGVDELDIFSMESFDKLDDIINPRTGPRKINDPNDN